MKTLALFFILMPFLCINVNANENYSHVYSESEMISLSFEYINYNFTYTENAGTVAMNPIQNEGLENFQLESDVVFRHNQRLKSRDGREIYLYSSGKCEMYYYDRLEVSCEYSVIGNEIRLIDNGRVIYKGSFTYGPDRQTLSSLSIAGTIYFKK